MSLNTVCLQVLVFRYFLHSSAIQKKLRELSCVNFIINGLDLRNNIKCRQVQYHNFLSKNPTNLALCKSEVEYFKNKDEKTSDLTFIQAPVLH